MDKNNIIQGKCKVFMSEGTAGVACIGFTTEDGLVVAQSEEISEATADQTLLILKKPRTKVQRTLKFSPLEITPAMLRLAWGLSSTIGTDGSFTVSFTPTVPEWNLEVQGPAPNGKVYKYVTDIWRIESGDITWSKANPTSLEVTCEEIGTPGTDGTDVFGTMTTIGSYTAG